MDHIVCATLSDLLQKTPDFLKQCTLYNLAAYLWRTETIVVIHTYIYLNLIFFCLCRFDRKEVAEVNKIHQCVTKIIAIHAQAVSNQGYGQQMNYFTTSYLRNIFLKLSYIIHRRRLYKIILNCF